MTVSADGGVGAGDTGEFVGLSCAARTNRGVIAKRQSRRRNSGCRVVICFSPVVETGDQLNPCRREIGGYLFSRSQTSQSSHSPAISNLWSTLPSGPTAPPESQYGPGELEFRLSHDGEWAGGRPFQGLDLSSQNGISGAPPLRFCKAGVMLLA